MAATAVSELAMDPPSMLICVNNTASLSAPLSQNAPFCINILHRSHEEIAHWCSGGAKGEARFERGVWADGPLRIPYLTDSQAAIFCTNEQAISYGTHGIYIGKVLKIDHHPSVDPLIYVDGRYGIVG